MKQQGNDGRTVKTTATTNYQSVFIYAFYDYLSLRIPVAATRGAFYCTEPICPVMQYMLCITGHWYF